MKSSRLPNGYWTKDRIQEVANNHTKRGEFYHQNGAAYKAAKKKGKEFFEQVCAHMDASMTAAYSDEELQLEALKYVKRGDFRNNSFNEYDAAHDREGGFLDRICSHMDPPLTAAYTVEEIRLEALKYTKRSDFATACVGAYTAARKRGKEFFEQIVAHMDPPLTAAYSLEELKTEANKHQKRSDFQRANASMYLVACNSSNYEEICAHMDPPLTAAYTVEEICIIANDCNTYSEFRKRSNGALKAAIRMGILDEIRSHMVRMRGSSSAEKEVYEFIKSFYFSINENSRNIIPPFELDIFIPELNLAIEYSGLYWHSEEYRPDKNYHFNKMKLCNEKGIRLITIFSDEWIDRQSQVKNYLLSVLNKNELKIGARKTELKEVNRDEATKFLEAHHIQGSTRFDVAFGLYYQNDLIGVMTGGKHHRQGQEKNLILNRLAFKSGVSVSGGSSKLLQALIAYAKRSGYRQILTWSDNRWSEGRVYEKMGFTLKEKLSPDYSYVPEKKEERISKQSCQKKNLIKKGARGTMENTEQELALTLGLHRIWDCGKKAWILNI